MNIQTYTLAPSASRLDKSTLRVMKAWHRSGRDFLRAAIVTMLLAGVAFSVLLVAVPSRGLFGTLGGGLATVGIPIGWLAHRRGHPVDLGVNRKARSRGITLGVLLFPLGIGIVATMTTGLNLLIGTLAAVPALQLIPGIAMVAIGWFAASLRWRQINDPIYP